MATERPEHSGSDHSGPFLFSRGLMLILKAAFAGLSLVAVCLMITYVVTLGVIEAIDFIRAFKFDDHHD
jgi:hypothetical protein